MMKNKMMRIAAFLLVAVLLSVCVISGTYAKYTSTIAGSDSARVAKWDIQVGGVTANSSDEFTFNLFNTIVDTLNDGNETDIAPADGSIIAPGTKGSFKIEIANESEVTAKYAIAFSAVNTAGIPVQFSTDGTTWTSDITTLNVADTQIEIDGSASVTVYWQWVFDGNDTTDTNLGLAGSATIAVTASVTATQVD